MTAKIIVKKTAVGNKRLQLANAYQSGLHVSKEFMQTMKPREGVLMDANYLVSGPSTSNLII